MIELDDYGNRVVNRFSMLGNWLAVVVSIRNFFICYRQLRRTRGKIHIVNIAQVVILGVDRVLYGIIPLFEITICDYYPLLISFWHITYILFYVVMFMRLLILESDRNSLWIKVVGVVLIAVRFADWPYELAQVNVVQNIMNQEIEAGNSCQVTWGPGVIIFNFIGDALANLFLSGMFVRRLYLHIRMSRSVMTRQNRLIEQIARKSLVCLILTFVVNLAMNLLKITSWLGDKSDAFTVYFQLIESTLLVEALRVGEGAPGGSGHPVCSNCGLALQDNYFQDKPYTSQQHDQDKNSNPLRDTETNASVLRDISFFDAASYTEEIVLRDAQTASGTNEMSKRSASPSDGIVSPPPMQQPPPSVPPPAAPPPAAPQTVASSPISSSNNPMDRRRPLSKHPEWSNNDYRMF